MEALEERLGGQLSELRRQSERPRDSALARLEEKLQTSESSGMKLDLRLSELTGNVRGLSEEMQVQIKRVDVMDERLSEWRQRMEEEIRQKYDDFEKSIQRACSSFRVGNSCVEEAQKRQQQRLQKLEAELSELGAEEKKTQEAILAAHERIDATEARQLEEIAALQVRPAAAPEPCGAGACVADAALAEFLEKRVGDVTEKLDQVVQDSFDLRAVLAAQEEQLRSLRTLSDAREEHGRALTEQIERGDFVTKLDKLRETVQEEAKLRAQKADDVQLLWAKVEYQEQSQEELRLVCDQLASDTSITMAVEECRARIEESEGRLASFDADVQAAREATQLAPRLGQLVVQLQALVPRVSEQEAAIRELQRAAGQFCPPAR